MSRNKEFGIRFRNRNEIKSMKLFFLRSRSNRLFVLNGIETMIKNHYSRSWAHRRCRAGQSVCWNRWARPWSPVAAEPVVAEPAAVIESVAPAAASWEKSSDCKVEYIVVKDDTPVAASAPQLEVPVAVEEPKPASTRFDSRPNIRNKSKFGLKRRFQH